jgi:hypothetical protein
MRWQVASVNGLAGLPQIGIQGLYSFIQIAVKKGGKGNFFNASRGCDHCPMAR